MRALSRTSSSSDRESLQPRPSPYPQHVDPSPVDSNNSTSSDATDFEVEEPRDTKRDSVKSNEEEILSPSSQTHDSPDPV